MVFSRAIYRIGSKDIIVTDHWDAQKKKIPRTYWDKPRSHGGRRYDHRRAKGLKKEEKGDKQNQSSF